MKKKLTQFELQVQKNKRSVEKQLTTFEVGDIVKIVNCSNTGGLNKNGRTGKIISIRGGQYQVQLHCTQTGGHGIVSIFVKVLNRHVGLTSETRWFEKDQIIKCS